MKAFTAHFSRDPENEGTLGISVKEAHFGKKRKRLQ